MSDWTRGLVSAAPSQPFTYMPSGRWATISTCVWNSTHQEIQRVDHQKLTTRVPPGQLLTCPRSKRENQRICFKQGGIFVFPIPPALDRNGFFFFFFFCRWAPRLLHDPEFWRQGTESVSELNQFQSAPWSQFTLAFLQITLQAKHLPNTESSKYPDKNKKSCVDLNPKTISSSK